MVKLGQMNLNIFKERKGEKKNYEMNFNNFIFVLQFWNFLFQLSQII